MKNKLLSIILLFIILLLLFIPTISNTLFAESTNYNTATEENDSNTSNQPEINTEPQTNSNFYFNFKSITQNKNQVVEEVYTNNDSEKEELLNSGFVFDNNKHLYTKTTNLEDLPIETVEQNNSFLTNSSLTKHQEKINEIFDLQNQISKKMSELFNF